jgi:hypothetical protein
LVQSRPRPQADISTHDPPKREAVWQDHASTQ